MSETATIVPATELARRRAEREKQRQQRAQYAGSILDQLDDDDQRACVASKPKGTP
jgi:hypothetical protein